jgi:hypothetical protein
MHKLSSEDHFKLCSEALKKFNPNGKIFTTDMNPELSSACQISDGYLKVPRVTDKDYLKILKVFLQHQNYPTHYNYTVDLAGVSYL